MKYAVAAATVAVFSLTAPAAPAAAQDDDAERLSLEEIVVTARKREESLQDIPVAINAFTADDIADANLTSLEDISSLASGFYFFNQGQSQPGRYNTQLRFRGLNQQQFSPSFETGALFIDGVYVLNGGTSLSLMDIERVEVIKGPQAAYFGRNTFGGAVNFITRNPSLDTFSGTVDVAASHRENYELNAYVEGPLIEDRLSGSLGIRYYDKEGHYEASDGGSLGDEQTTTINGKLFLQASDNLSMTFRASYSEDDDGAPAAAYVAGRLDINDTCEGRTITTAAGEVVQPFNYVCGQVPDINAAQPVAGSRLIDGNTMIPANVFDDITTGPRPNGGPSVTDIGLKRETLRLSATLNYAVNDYEIDAILGYNDQATNWVRDFDLTGFSNAYSSDPQGLEDSSIELRITSPQDGRLRWLAGVNYYEQEFIGSGAGGQFVFACLGSADPAIDCVPGVTLAFPNSLQNADESDVLGIFGAIDYDINDELTVTLEGRYQRDTLLKGGIVGEGGIESGALEIENNEFLPRVILRWQPFDETTTYVSYAKGVVPGDVNQQFLNSDAREQAQYLEQFPGIGDSTPQEELDSYEIGIKQTLFDGRGYINFAAYWQEWIGIKGRSTAIINETCDATGPNGVGNTTGCTFPGVMAGDPKQIESPPGSGELIPFFNPRNVLLDGDADIWGWELEAGGQINEYWSINGAVAYVNAEYTRYEFNFVERIVGFANVAGNQTPRTPEWSGNLSSTVRWPWTDGRELFVRADITYMGEVFTDETNLAFIDSYFLTNVRAGIDTDAYRVELFIRNLFDEDAWATGARFSDTSFPVDFSNFFVQQGFNLTPQDRQEFGLRAIFRF